MIVCLSTYLFMCFGGVAFKGRGGILWFESFQTQAKTARFAEKIAYPAFKSSQFKGNMRDLLMLKIWKWGNGPQIKK